MRPPRADVPPCRRQPPSAARRGSTRSRRGPRSTCAFPCGSPERSRISSPGRFQPSLAKAPEERALAVHFGLLLAQQHLLEREHALRPLQVIELQAPVDRLEQLPGILAVPQLRRRDVAVLFEALVGRLRRHPRKTGKDAREPRSARAARSPAYTSD